jgi:hypothetical protein
MIPYRKTSFRAALIVLALGVTSPLAASADECRSLWIERNQTFKNQGYCFGSTLGKGFFGNSGCTTKSPSLSSSQQKRVAAIKRREGQLNCAAKKKNWTVASLRNNSSGRTRSTSTSSSEPTGGGILGSMLRGGIRAIENAGNSNSSSGGYKISKSEAQSKALEWCHSYWLKGIVDHGYSHCVIDYCSEYNGSWSCEADPKR